MTCGGPPARSVRKQSRAQLPDWSSTVSTSLPPVSSTAVISEASKSTGGGPLKSSVAKNSWAWSMVAPSASLAITAWCSWPPPFRVARDLHGPLAAPLVQRLGPFLLRGGVGEPGVAPRLQVDDRAAG